MTKLIAFTLMTLAAAAAHAIPPPPPQELPAPEMLPLLGIGVLAVWAARRFKK